jgi:hypothetical protein
MGLIELAVIAIAAYCGVRLLFRPRQRQFPVETHTCIVLRDGSMIHDDSCRCGRNQGVSR